MIDLWTQANRSLRPHAEFAGERQGLYSLEERMAVHNVSAVSIAVIHEAKLSVEVGVGQLAADDPTPADAQTVFGACSISKAVTAMAMLRLVDAGVVSLDEDVNERLQGWKLCDESDRPVKVTLRQLLSHTGGVNIHGADGYDPNGPVPTLDQVLRGEPPCVSAPIRVTVLPGSRYEYSSGGYTVCQKLICDATGKSFEAAMQSLVFEPLAIAHSTFRADAAGMKRAASHVSLIRAASPETNLVWPAQAPAGLWTTAGDLARLILAIQSSYAGTGNFLSSDLASEAMKSQTPHQEIGLGLFLLGEEASRRFNHTGGYLGYKAEIMGWLNSGFGVAILVNNGYTGPALKAEVREALQRTYGWPL